RLMTLPEAGEEGFVALPAQAAEPDVLVEGADLGEAVQQTVRMSSVRADGLPTLERVAGVEAPEGSHWDDANDALRIEGGLDTADLEYTVAGTRSPSLATLEASESSGHDELLALPEAAAGIGAQGAALVTDGMGVSERIRAVH
ncbi:hypothetical protein, partial [Escherichia coli]|uniref:hypothetical protein n=1 Tax=Escherichia coli TaxID=562 RepID=UPI00164F183D